MNFQSPKLRFWLFPAIITIESSFVPVFKPLAAVLAYFNMLVTDNLAEHMRGKRAPLSASPF